MPGPVPWSGPIPDRHQKYVRHSWWKCLQGEPVRSWLAGVLPVSLREVAAMAGVREDFWDRSHQAVAKALAAVLRYEIPEAWPLWALCHELRQNESSVLRTVLQSKGRFRLVTVPGFGLLVLSHERNPSPDFGRGRKGRVERSGRGKKRSREEALGPGRSGPRPRDPYDHSD